jgi:uncharacterized protein YuzE
MASRRAVNTETELLELAAERVALPEGIVRLDYQPDADLLYITFKDAPRPTRTESDLDADVIYNYEGTQLVSVEILDIYGVFTDATRPAA